MQYRRLGNSGLRVSEISLGSWLAHRHGIGEDASVRIVHEAFDLGINFFDTANVYAYGEAESTLGKALTGRNRSTFVLSTKVFGRMGDGPNDRGLSRKHIIEQLNGSLRRLRLDYVDILYCHRHDPDTPLDETLRAFDDLIRQGKVLYIGVSEWSAAQIEAAMRTSDRLLLNRFVSNQLHYNMLHRQMEFEVLPACEQNGLGLVAFSPLAEGVLTGKYKSMADIPKGSRADAATRGSLVRHPLTQEVIDTTNRLAQVASDLGIPLAQLALAWTLRLPAMASALVGASRPSQLHQNADAAGYEIPPDALARIEEILGRSPQQ